MAGSVKEYSHQGYLHHKANNLSIRPLKHQPQKKPYHQNPKQNTEYK